MEIAFQNKREDLEAFCNYMVTQTEQGKTFSKRAFRNLLSRTVWVSLFIGSIFWGLSGRWQTGIIMTVFFLIIEIPIMLLMTGFKPIYYLGMQAYRNQNKSITQEDLRFFQLSRMITIDDDWLEVRSSEAVHRWRWNRVEKIGLMPNFVFIHVGNCPVVYIPKRDFSSEDGFIEFGKKLVELKEKSKDQLNVAEA
jgi:hypothetical protein